MFRRRQRNQDFLVDQDEGVRRYVNGTLQLTVEAHIYEPFQTDVNIIKEIRTRYYPELLSINADVSATDGFDTSGWDTSSAFPDPYDTSGVYEGIDGDEFEYYINNAFGE